MLAHPDFKSGNDRSPPITAPGNPLLRCCAVPAALELEEHANMTHNLADDWRHPVSPGPQTCSGHDSSRPLQESEPVLDADLDTDNIGYPT
jgi:hypothetical protein